MTLREGLNMSEQVSSVYDWQHIEIFARQIIGKKAFLNIATFWQEKHGDSGHAEKQPVRLYIVNDGSTPSPSPQAGSPVKAVKLCKRAIVPDYPKNTVTGTKKSRIIHRYSLVLLAEYENGEFRIIHLPRQMSAPGAFREGNTMVLCDFIDPGGQASVPQRTGSEDLAEKLGIIPGVGYFSAFEYILVFPISGFEPGIRAEDLENPTLQSTIILSNLRYESDVAEPVLLPAGENSSIWTTAVDFMIFEDILVKLGVDQDIVVPGLSEL